jgi:hypothetical protein
MKRFLNVLPYLFAMILVLGNLFFFRPSVLMDMPILAWVLITLLGGGLFGFGINFLVDRAAQGTYKLGRLFFLSCLLALWIVFGMAGIFYTPNSFSETTVQIIPASPPAFPPEDPQNFGVIDQLVLKTLRVDHQIVDLNTACHVAGAPVMGTDHNPLVLRNTPGSGAIECTLYPLNEISFDFDTIGESFSTEFVIDHQYHYQKAPSAHDDATVIMDTWYLLKDIIPNLVSYFTTVLILWMLALVLSIWGNKKDKTVTSYLGHIPKIIWFLAGSLVCYCVFYMAANFFIWDYVKPYPLLPSNHRENDFNWLMQTTQYVILEGHTLLGSYYMPDSFYLFTPLALLDYALAYNLFIVIKTGVFITITFLLPVLAFSKKHTDFALFFVVTGLFSFGMQFELDRGQWYTLVYGLLIFSLWLFHRYYHHRWLRWTAYALFCMAVQMKLTPALFVFLFIKDWRDIRKNMIRIYTLGIVNVLLVFLVGFSSALAFIHSILTVSKVSGSYCWFGNHSIPCLVILAQAQSFIDISHANTPLILIVVACIGLLMYRAYRTHKSRHASGIDPFLLIGFTLAALLIPGENHDYTLIALPMVLSVAINILLSVPEYKVDGIDLAILSFFYTMTLISYQYKVGSLISLSNCMPLLFMLVYLTVIAMRSGNINHANIPESGTLSLDPAP